MKRKLALFSLLCLGPTNALGQSMGQPGYYGYIEIGANPQPPLLISNAVMGNPGVYTGSPIYMHVPPEHARAWSRYCHLYGACDWVVFFVDNAWYESVYVPGFNSGTFGAPQSYAPAYYPPPDRHRPPEHVKPPPRPGGPNVRPPPPRPTPHSPPANPGGAVTGSRGR